MSIKKVDCDTINGTAHVIVDLPSDSFTYRWSTGGNTDSIYDLNVGAYTVTVTHYDSIGNFIDSLIDTANVSLGSVAISIFSVRYPTCGINNGSILSSITGGSGAYTFYTVSGGVNYGAGVNLPAGLFQVVAYDNITGCSSDSIPVVIRDTGGYFTIADTVIVGNNCFGDTMGSIALTIVGGKRPYRYLWSSGAGTDSFLVNLSQGIYTVTISDSLCPATLRVFSFEVPGPTDTLELLASISDDTCYRKVGSVQLSATGGNSIYTYYWSDGSVFSGTYDSLVAGVYAVAVVDERGCTDSLTLSLGNSGGPSAIVNLLDSVCIGDSTGAIRLTVTSRDRPHHFQWSHDASLDTSFVKFLAAGTYTVTITNNILCDTIMNITVGNYFMPTLEVSGDTSILQGQSASLIGAIDNPFIDSTYWLPSYNIVELGTNASVYPLSTTLYHLYVRLENSCFLTDSALVQVDSVPIEVRLPNIFTPNSDGVNDLFIIGVNEAVRNIELHIFDRWGNNVFDSFDKNIYWDGFNKFTNKLSETGVYSYYLYIETFLNQKRIIKEGNITLIR